MDKKEKIIELVQKTYSTTLETFHNEKWDENDLFNFACWLFNSYVGALADLNAIPLNELKQRVKSSMNDNIDNLFDYIQNAQNTN